jgi:Tfp pilus assembly protein PilX
MPRKTAHRTSLKLIHRRCQRSDQGFALLLTVIVLLIVTALLIVILDEGMQSLPLAQQAQQYQSALQAADAGVQDYISRLDANTAYYLKTSDSDNPAMPGGCSAPTGTSCWEQVSGSNNTEWYTYVVNNAKTVSTGTVYLTVSGAAGQDPAASGNPHYVVRTIKEAISLAAFDSSLYFTQYEIEDPEYVTGFDNGAATPTYAQACEFDAWQYNTYLNGPTTSGSSYGPDSSLCSGYEIYFIGGDTLNGPIFSDDEFHICGSASFPQGASSAWDQGSSNDVSNASQTSDDTYYGNPGQTTPAGSSSNAYYLDTGCTGTPSFPSASSPYGKQPAGASERLLTTNTELESDVGSTTDGGGCMYYGPIQVTLNASGSMKVVLDSNPAADSSVSSLSGTSTCTGTSVTPNNGLIYDATSPSCSDLAVCGADVYIVGGSQVGSAITIGSDYNITIEGNITDVSTTGGDILGLSAVNYIKYPDPASTDPISGTTLSAVANLTIDAAMVSTEHTIYLPDWTTDGETGSCTASNLGNLNIVGSLAQVFRGPVGTFCGNTIASGYAKNYTYDSRLQYLQPPYFNSATLPDWQQTSFAECNPTAAPTTSTC